MSYDGQRAAFIAGIVISEAEEGMKAEKEGSFKWRKWKKLHDAGMDLVFAYDKQINNNTIYATVNRLIDVVNRELLKEEECTSPNESRSPA